MEAFSAAIDSQQDDAPIARLASMANKKAGGLGAVTSDQDCIKVMRALYDIMRTIHISYQSPQAMNDPGLSYDIKTVQSIQYPRDTVEKRSGTCIDLAILYAAMMNSVDIRPYLVVTDDHCFPVARTPSGNFVPVEATGVGDGYNKAFTFEQAVKSGARTWQKVNQTGRFVLVDVRKMWMSGVANPELASLPPDILDRWGITALVNAPAAPAAQVAARGPNQEQQAAAQPDTRQPAPAPAVVAGIDGRWIYTVPVGGRLTSGRFAIRGGNSRLMLLGSASYQAMGPDGRYHYFREVDHCVGSLRGRSVSAECGDVSLTMDGRPLQPPGLPLYLSLMLAPGGKSMQGQVRNTLGMVEPVSMRR
ncbi:MAG: transglutaminase-like domain-containing protein [Syntrophobacteraceae bacterium]